jgi:hypothetical protein
MKRLFATLAAVIAAASIAYATVGTPPIPSNGFGAVDGTWLNGLAGGVNSLYQYGISAAGTTQATATQLPSGIELQEVDTAAASSGVALPFCYQGTKLALYNNGAQTLTVYPNVTNNPSVTPAAQDTIDNTTSVSVTSHTAELFFCAKNGVWAAK